MKEKMAAAKEKIDSVKDKAKSLKDSSSEDSHKALRTQSCGESERNERKSCRKNE